MTLTHIADAVDAIVREIDQAVAWHLLGGMREATVLTTRGHERLLGLQLELHREVDRLVIQGKTEQG
jgi:hypothetical protein